MSDRNIQLFKYEVSFELQLYASSATAAFARACELQRLVVSALLERGVAGAFTDEQLPSAGLTGAPHGIALDGWRCIYTVRSAD